MNSNLKKFLSFSRSERIAIIALISIITISMIAKCLIINHPSNKIEDFHNLDSIVTAQRHAIDSLKTADSIRRAERLASFSKKTSIYKGQERKPKVFREKAKEETAASTPAETAVPIIDINKADTNMLKKLPSIGTTFAKRIVNYRDQLGGFIECEQIMEVFGMDSTRYNTISPYLEIDSLASTNKLRINYLYFKEILKHPYLQYDDVKKIINHREQKGLITSWQQLLTITGDSLDPRLERYLEY
ncbi:MAG: ComEA family DNA-binding protein [Candidatus Limimorpha sp.]